MRLSDSEKRTAIAACTHAIAASEAYRLVEEVARYRNLRKKFETALRQEKA